MSAVLPLLAGVRGDVNMDSLTRYIFTTERPFAESIGPTSILVTAALASGWMYVAPSMKAGRAEGGEVEAWLQLFGNILGAVLVVFNVGSHYIGLVEAARDANLYLRDSGFVEQGAPRDVGGLLRGVANCGSDSLAWLRRSKLDILILAALSATSLAATAIFYKDAPDESEGLLAVKAIITLLVYTLIHTLPISLILEVPWLNFLLIKLPTWPVTTALNLYRKCFWSGADFAQHSERVQGEAELLSLRRQIVGSLYGLVAKIKAQGFSRDLKRRIFYTPDLPEGFADLLPTFARDDTRDLNRLLPLIISTYSNSGAPNTVTAPPQRGWAMLSALDSLVRKVVGVGGAALVGASIAGYMKLNYELYNKKLGNPVAAAAIMAPTLVVTEVLTMYFGWLGFAGAYDYLKGFLTCKAETPYPFKLNPLLSTFFITTTYFLNCFSYGTAWQLVIDTYDPKVYGKVLVNMLLAAAKYGIIVYCNINCAQLLQKLVEPLAKRIGTAEQQQFVMMLDSLKRMAALIDELDPKALQKVLQSIDQPEVLAQLGLTRGEDGMVNIAAKRAAQASAVRGSGGWWQSCHSFWRSCCGLITSISQSVNANGDERAAAQLLDKDGARQGYGAL